MQLMDRMTSVGALDPSLHEAWDHLVLTCGGSIFQTVAFCSVIDAAWPGHREPRHLVLREHGELRAAIPAYLYRSCFRLNYYRASASSAWTDPVLLSHALVGWYGYPVASTAHDRSDAIRELARAAVDDDAICMFAGIRADDVETMAELERQGFELAVFHTLMSRDLAGVPLDDPTAALPPKGRHRVRNMLSQAARAGTTIRRFENSDRDDVLDVFERMLESKRTPNDLFPRDFVATFLATSIPGREVWVATDSRERLIGAHLCFCQGSSYLMWQGAHDSGALREFRPSHALYAHAIRRARALSCDEVECGRGPSVIKRQHGFRPRALWCAVRGSEPAQHRRATRWIRRLQDIHYEKYASFLS